MNEESGVSIRFSISSYALSCRSGMLEETGYVDVDVDTIPNCGVDEGLVLKTGIRGANNVRVCRRGEVLNFIVDLTDLEVRADMSGDGQSFRTGLFVVGDKRVSRLSLELELLDGVDHWTENIKFYDVYTKKDNIDGVVQFLNEEAPPLGEMHVLLSREQTS